MRADRAAVLCVLWAACSGADLSLGDGRTAADSGVVSDGAQPDAATNSDLDFEPPRVIAELESADVSDDDPSLTADLLLLCFNSKRDAGMGAEDIWCSRRANSAEAWAAPEPQTELNTERRETGIALSLDGLALWFSSDRADDEAGLDVFVATRASRDDAWSEPVRVPELSSQDDDLVSSIDETGRTLMMARRTRSTNDDEEDADDYHIFVAQRASASDPWQAPSAVSELDSDDGESDAFLVGAGLQLIFTRRADLLLTQRSSLDAPFEPGEPLHALNSEEQERDAWSNSTFTYVVFSSDRDGSFRLYEAERKRAGSGP
jgi:hypothetical protein